jgi:hypothetical protein
MTRRAIRSVIVLGAAGLLVGCGGTDPWDIVYPAKGSVTYKGEPLAGAMIMLYPVDESAPSTVRPSTTSKDDGTFEVGAPAGEYKAVVLHFPVVGPKENPSPGKNDLPRKYAKPETTDLKLMVVEGENDLRPLEIKADK